MTHGRTRLLCALSGLGLAASLGITSSSPAAAEPTIDEVQARVDTLYHEAEIASERYNDARIELEDLREDLSSLRADQQRQDRRLEQVRTQVRDSVVRQLQGQGLSAIGQVVVSEDPGAFVSEMTTMSAFNQLQQGLFSDFATEVKALELRSTAYDRRAEQVASVEARLAAEKQTIDDKVADAEELLARLEAEERERLEAAQAREETVSRAAVPAAPEEVAAAPASGRAAAAVAYALAQVGDAYVYGAAGPDAFDCSGLTMMAWGAAGVGLPHSSSAQSAMGTPVSSSALQPGDLVFYYSPISHVGIYVGNGTIVHAANPGTGTTTAPVFSMPYSGAVRPG